MPTRLLQLMLLGFGVAGATTGFATDQDASLPEVGASPPSIQQPDMLPPNAKAGECYARVFAPAEYTTSEERLLKRDAAQRFDVIPARFEWAEEQVLVQDAFTKLVEVPAEYDTVSETIEVEASRLVWRNGSGRKARAADVGLVATAKALGLPEKTEAGQCFAEFKAPARFETREEQVLKRQASARIEVIPARFDWVEEQRLVKPASKRIEEVPAVYEWAEEQVLDQPAHTVWKKGRGPIEKVDHGTGEIMCLVEVPATYKTLRKRILKTAATTREIEVPAEYETVKVRKMTAAASEKRIEIPAEYETITKRSLAHDETLRWMAADARGAGEATGRRLCRHEVPAKTQTVTRRVVKTPARTQRVEVPAEYKTQKVRTLAEAAKTVAVDIPAEYETLTKRTLVRDGRMEWRSILCETNVNAGVVTQLQRALLEKGHNPGPIDGVIGSQTIAAMSEFQTTQGLSSGQITLATLEALGIQNANR